MSVCDKNVFPTQEDKKLQFLFLILVQSLCVLSIVVGICGTPYHHAFYEYKVRHIAVYIFY